jgi:hypothetical protein
MHGCMWNCFSVGILYYWTGLSRGACRWKERELVFAGWHAVKIVFKSMVTHWVLHEYCALTWRVNTVMSFIARYSCIFAFLHRLRMITWSSHTPHMSHDLSRLLLTISDDFYFQLTSSACCGSQFSTAQHPRSSVKQLPRTPVCRDIKSVRPRQHTASARHRSGDLEILW